MRAEFVANARVIHYGFVTPPALVYPWNNGVPSLGFHFVVRSYDKIEIV